MAKLDQLVMSGCGDLLLDKKCAVNPEAQLFMRELPNLLSTIEQIHRAIKESRLDTLKQLMTSKRLASDTNIHSLKKIKFFVINT